MRVICVCTMHYACSIILSYTISSHFLPSRSFQQRWGYRWHLKSCSINWSVLLAYASTAFSRSKLECWSSWTRCSNWLNRFVSLSWFLPARWCWLSAFSNFRNRWSISSKSMSSENNSLASNATWFESATELCFNKEELARIYSILPVLLQLCRSAWIWNPCRHEQRNEPWVLKQVWSQGFDKMHSFISSSHWDPVQPTGQWHTFDLTHFPPLRHCLSQIAGIKRD